MFRIFVVYAIIGLSIASFISIACNEYSPESQDGERRRFSKDAAESSNTSEISKVRERRFGKSETEKVGILTRCAASPAVQSGEG